MEDRDDSSSSSNSSTDVRCNKRSFFTAIERDDSENVKLILKKPKCSHLVNAQDANYNDNTPLHMAINRGSKTTVDKDKNREIINILLSKNADVTKQNKAQKTALDLVLEKPDDPYLQTIEPLLEPPGSSSNVAIKRLQNVDDDDDGPDSKKCNTNSDSRTDFILDKSTTYRASGTKLALHGIIYQAKLLGLFAKRGKDNHYDFRLATEMDSAGKFDDVVFTYKHRDKCQTRFLQAKHKKDPQEEKIKISDLYSTDYSNPFCLQKYLISFCCIQEDEFFKETQKYDFTIITNADLNISRNPRSTKSKSMIELEKLFVKKGNLEDDDILFIKNKNFKAEEYKFNDEQKPKLKEMLMSSLWKNALESQITSKNDSVKEIIQAIKISNSQEQIDEAKIASQCLEKENSKTRILIYARKFSKVIDTFWDTEKNRATSKDENQELTELIKELEKLPARLNGSKIVDRKCNEILYNVEEVCRLGTSYKNDGNKMTELQIIIDNLKDSKNELLKISNKTSCSESTDDETKRQIDDYSEKSEIVKAIFKKIPNLESDKLRELSHKAISEISVILLTLDDNKINEYLEAFLEKFRIVVRFPNEEELGDFIKEEIGEYFHLLNADLVSDSFEKEMVDFLKSYSKGKAPYYTWKKCDDFFNELENKIRSVMTSGLGIIYPEELRSYGIVVQEHLTWLHEFLSAQDQMLYIQTKFTLLSAIKVLQTLESEEFKDQNPCLRKRDGFMFFPLKTLLLPKPQEFIVKCFSADDNYHILVIEYQSKADDEQKKYLIQRLQSALLNKTNKKIIFIARKKEISIVIKYEMEDLGVKFMDLTPESKCKMLEREIIFQGDKRKFNQIIDEVLACKIIDQDGLTKLVGKSNIQIGDTEAFSSTGYVTDYYIDRHFHRQKINMENFRKNIQSYFKKSWIFLITGANETDLNILNLNLLENWKELLHSPDDGKKYDKGIVLASGENNEMIFNDLCIKCTRSVIHWLEYQNGDLFWRNWRDFKEDTKKIDLNKFVDESFQKNYVLSEDDIRNKKNILDEAYFTNPAFLEPKVILLANDSGMGKSVVLSSIATKMVNFGEFSNLWIIRINFIKHAKEKMESSLGNIKTNWNKNECIRFISKMAITGKPSKNIDIRIQRELLIEILEGNTDDTLKQPKIVIHFDGFDEICSLSSANKRFRFKENATFLLKMLKNDCNVTQFWVTTRFHEVKYLEKEFETVALILNRLTQSEQKEFSNKYWKWSLQFLKEKKPTVACQKLKEHLINIESTLSQLSTARPVEFFKCISDMLKGLNKKKVKNAYLNKLREDIFNLDFSQFINLLIEKLGTNFTNVPLHLEMLVQVISEKKINLLTNFGLLDLYRGFVESKFTHFLSKSEMEESNAKQARQCVNTIDKCLKEHIQFARELYFPRNKKEQIENVISPTRSTKRSRRSDSKTDEDEKYLTKCGLLKKNEENLLEFIRPTYAEYFFTESLIKELNDTKVQEILFKEVFLDDDYEPIRQLFNGQLEHLYDYKERIEAIQNDYITKKISRTDRKNQLSQIKNEELDSLLVLKVKFAGRRAIIDSINGLTNRSDLFSRTIFHVMIDENRLATIRFIFDKVKNDKNEETLTKLLQATDKHFQQTALQYSICSGSWELIKVFLQSMLTNLQSDIFDTFLLPNKLPNNSGSEHSHKSILHVAVESGNTGIIKTLLQWMKVNLDGEKFKKLLLATDKNNKTVQDYCSEFGFTEIYQFITERLEIQNVN